ncbi:hypothetical protein ACF08A_25640 [Streptomyces cellulosae]
MRRSVYNHVRAVPTLGAAAHTATATGTAADRALSGASGANEWHASAALLVHAGTVTDGTHTLALEVSDDGSTWAAAPASDLQGTLPALDSGSSNRVFEVGYSGTARYLRAVSTVAGATTGGVYGAVILLGFPNTLPIDRT